MTQTTCPKCDGKGRIAQYSHVINGVCFRCQGTGQVTVSEAQAKRMEAKRAEADAKQAAQMAEQETDRKAWAEEEAAWARYEARCERERQDEARYAVLFPNSDGY